MYRVDSYHDCQPLANPQLVSQKALQELAGSFSRYQQPSPGSTAGQTTAAPISPTYIYASAPLAQAPIQAVSQGGGGGIDTTTLLLIGGVLLFVMMRKK